MKKTRKKTKTPILGVKCAFCDKIYTTGDYLGINFCQADGCAACAEPEGIYCHDGSQYDMLILKWTDKSEVRLKNGDQLDVCDNCITSWLEKEWVEEAGTYWPTTLNIIATS